MRSARDPVGKLLQLLALASAGERNVGEFIRENADALACALNVPVGRLLELARLDDEALRIRCVPDLRVIRLRRKGLREVALLDAAGQAVEAVRSTSRWTDDIAYLVPNAILATSITNAPVEFIELAAPGFTVAIDRKVLARARRALLPLPDLVAAVDAQGLRFEWRAARGRLLLFPQEHASSKRLVIELPASGPRASGRSPAKCSPMAALLTGVDVRLAP